jgi:multisubunit Na+/H+ antiporter MnhG subunit
MNLPDLFTVLTAPGAALGCVVGVAIAFGLHWLAPEADLVFVQALIVAVCCFIGYVVFDHPMRKGSKRSD